MSVHLHSAKAGLQRPCQSAGQAVETRLAAPVHAWAEESFASRLGGTDRRVDLLELACARVERARV
jgi:hypothetical protein